MAESAEVIVPISEHTIQADLEEEKRPLLNYGQSSWIRNLSIACLAIIFCVGLLAGIYLLYTENYDRTLDLHSGEAQTGAESKLKLATHAEVKKDDGPTTKSLTHYVITKIKSIFEWFHS